MIFNDLESTLKVGTELGPRSVSKAISHQVEMQLQGLSWSQAVECSCDLLSSAVSTHVDVSGSSFSSAGQV